MSWLRTCLWSSRLIDLWRTEGGRLVFVLWTGYEIALW